MLANSDSYVLASWPGFSLLGRFLKDEDVEKSERVMLAMMQMTKLDINGLQQAYDQV